MPSSSLLSPRRFAPKALSWLPLFIILSLAAHFGALVFFYIAYPPAGSVVRRSAEVYFLKPDSEAAELMGPWLDAADPSLYSRFQTDRRTQIAEPDLEYVASFDWTRPALQPLEARPLLPEKSVHFTTAQTIPSPAPAAASRLKLTFSGGLAARNFEPPDVTVPVPPAGEIPESPTFSLAVGADGRPLYVLLETSSGLSDLDAAARGYLLRGHFAPAESENAPPVWGRATFHWPAPAAP